MSDSIRQLDSPVIGHPEKRSTRRERRRAETRERIIRHALRLFAERGVMATTVEDITNAADVGKGTFFNYFPSKEHILPCLCQMQMGKIREFVAGAINSPQPMDQLLYRLALTITEEFEDSPGLVQGILCPSISSESMRSQMAADFERDRQMLAELMAARQTRGEIRDDSAPVELAQQFQCALLGTTVLWSLDPSEPLSERLKNMSKFFWSGIRSENSTTQDGEKRISN
jgi:AcrR family transcriptional regulator